MAGVSTRVVAGGIYAVGSGSETQNALGTTYTGTTNDSTETDVQVPWRTAGTFTNLLANVTVYGGIAGAVSTRKGGVTQTLTAAISGTGIKEDTTHSNAVTAGDLWDFDVTNNANTIEIFAVTFTGTSLTATRVLVGGVGNSPVTVASATSYFWPCGANLSLNTTEAKAQSTARKAVSMTNMYINVTTRNHTDTMRNRIATANGTNVITTAAAGVTEDTAHIDAVTVGQLIDLTYVSVTSSTNQLVMAGIDITSSGSDTMIEDGDGLAASISTGVTTNFGLGGGMTPDTTETHYQCTIRAAYVFSNLNVEVPTNTIAATTNVNLRAGASNTGVVAAVGSSATGQVTDTTHTYTSAATDNMNFQVVVGTSAAHAITISQISVWIAPTGGAAATVAPRFFSMETSLANPRLDVISSNRPPMFVT